ncbi:MAG: TonB-dependent receptor [Novosphingobium sp.]
MNGISFLTGVLRVKYSVFLCSSLVALASPALTSPALADELGGDLAERERSGDITVVAAGRDLPLDQTGQAVSVIGTREIDAIQGADLTRVLERLPGVNFSRNGGLGAQTGLSIRGANADQTLVVIDGVRIADYTSPGGGYDIGNLLSGSLDRVELLRGSNSVVWGSQAIGGVLAVTTREVNGAELAAEYGAWDTVLTNATAGIAEDRYAASITAGYARTDGFSAQSAGTEDDGYRQWQVAGKGRYALVDGLNLRANGRYADSRLEIDLTGPDARDIQKTREGTGRLGLDYAGQGFSLSGGVALTDVRRSYETAWGPSSYKGSSRRVEMNGHVALPMDLALDFGADSEWSRARSTYDDKRKARLSSGHALIGRYADDWSLAAGLRLDDHSRFGTHWTFGANGSVTLIDNVRLRASYGEGFKAPTLYQLYGSFVGNAALKPERSQSYDAGIELGDRNAVLHGAVTVFRRDSRNLIDLDSSYTYANIARARAEGVEVEAGAKVSERFAVQAAYTYTKARDRTQARDLARRPRNLLTFGADWRTPLHDLSLGADIRMASDAVEYDWMGVATRLDGYAVVTLRASLPVSEGIELYGRVENVADVHYETAARFATAGRSAYIGARARF